MRLFFRTACVLCIVIVSAAVGRARQAPPPVSVSGHASTPSWARPLTNRTFERTPARLARGKYLVEGPAHCFLCHSENDWSRNGQPAEGKKGAGRLWTDYTTLPFVVSPNITPDAEFGAGKWTDDMLARAIREGVGHDGRALFFMPWEAFRALSDEDLASVVVYLRAIPPVRIQRPKIQLPPPITASLKPEPLTAPVPQPVFKTAVDRGKYLVTIGQCEGCHSAFDEQMQPIRGMSLGGGLHLKGSWGEVVTPNITSDPSGISYYTPEVFVQTIRTGTVVARKLNAVMPWSYFRNMTDQDLKAIFAYLRTVPPVKHRVNNTDPPTDCRVCKQKHGLGALNQMSTN
jgi:mono/diheme cytochrome c family protein